MDKKITEEQILERFESINKVLKAIVTNQNLIIKTQADLKRKIELWPYVEIKDNKQ